MVDAQSRTAKNSASGLVELHLRCDPSAQASVRRMVHTGRNNGTASQNILLHLPPPLFHQGQMSKYSSNVSAHKTRQLASHVRLGRREVMMKRSCTRQTQCPPHVMAKSHNVQRGMRMPRAKRKWHLAAVVAQGLGAQWGCCLEIRAQHECLRVEYQVPKPQPCLNQNGFSKASETTEVRCPSSEFAVGRPGLEIKE